MMKPRRSTRGLSPIFATLILIAIAVIAGIVVYMFVSGAIPGLTGGSNVGSEKITIQTASGDVSNANVTVLYQWTGGAQPNITSVLLRDASGNSLGQCTLLTGTTNPTVVGTVYQLGATVPVTMVAGNSYSVTLVTVSGGSFDSPSFAAVA